MQIRGIIPQLRTTDLASTIRFYTEVLGLTLDFEYDDFYAGVRAGQQVIHLKLVDNPDPSVEWVQQQDHLHLYLFVDDVDAAAENLRARGADLVRQPQEMPWGTRELVLRDDQGHTIYLGQAPPREDAS